jgi:transcription-repair coupling factor (superfamily II helicase)
LSESEKSTGTAPRLSDLVFGRVSGAVGLDGLASTSPAFVFSLYFQRVGGPLVWVTGSNQAAEQLAEDLAFFLPEALRSQVLVFPGPEADPYRGLSPHPGLSARRAVALSRLSRGFRGILLAPVGALMSRTVAPYIFRKRCLALSLGTSIPRETLISKLRSMGYVREDPVAGIGEFSFRGGIVDMFSPSHEAPVRIEYFGDEIESIRQFEPSTQRSVGLIPECEIVPMRETTPTNEEISAWHARAPEFWNEVRYAGTLSEYLQFTDKGELFNGFEFLFPLVCPLEAGLIDYLEDSEDGAHFLLQEPEDLLSAIDVRWREAREAYEERSREGAPVLPPERFYFERAAIERNLGRFACLRLETLSSAPETTRSFDFRPSRRYQGRLREMLSDIERWRADGARVVFAVPSEGMADRLLQILREYETPAGAARDGFLEALGKPLSVVTGRLASGFSSPELGLHVITEDELFGERQPHRRSEPRRGDAAGTFVSDFRHLQEGDYVVHLDHGIGIFKGLERLGVGERESEFVLIEYSGGAKLYVPVDRLDLVQKYSSGGVVAPPVDRLGGTSWKKTKARIKKSMRDLAEDLLKLYARREAARGHAFSPDDELMREFEEAFEYEETVDQRAAIEACKRDMESARPMDRLICGDVGYGKTEVGMRAAFKAVNDGKQVAVLAPTTVLAFQHFRTFGERFHGFPVRIEMMSRFLTRPRQKEIAEQTRSGLVDILIGTHRLLSRDVAFQRLGLVVVDEEQRFGVAQKERLKSLKAEVDVLTLSATPIPRTLNMSLVGIRDLSIIETPPKDRLAIQTVVMKFSHHIIRSAIDLELKRAGQIFFLHNSVETIHSMADTVRRLVPEARVAVAHGQMREELLEEVMLDFLNHRFDVLVCTTIIENGLDISRANTIVVNRADRFGLSQLYQLRGRVGRSHRRAYAYLLVSDEASLTGDARRRLAAIREFSELGAGFRLAALDLEIRGAGNLLGGEQSGHIEAVGFELYVQLLEQTIRELKGEGRDDEVRATVDLRLDIRIPNHYIDDSNLRLWLYKRVSAVEEEERLAGVREEVVDRFGRYPKPVSNLFDYARLRLRAKDLRVEAVERRGTQIFFRFRKDTPVVVQKVIERMVSRRDLRFSTDGALVASIEGEPLEIADRALDVLDLLAACC